MDWFVVILMAGMVAMFWKYFTWVNRRNRARLQILRADAEAQFKALAVESTDERYRFSGETAVVVDEVVRIDGSDDRIDDAWLIRFCRNPKGEYFQFISNSSRGPYIKHVPHNLARIALKKKYVPPKHTDG
ncbi:hypothetical protein [Paucibacter sp. M5-1]|uniref:hypothetical protein n=1 Tax=Paucibacter sp. M5-1 TaxID=3015998 RepID=UPI0022B85DB8|nr:hypothetical protein [Paucibacter sp. M5-1]MCZ7879546.1 hypothetical protein [Paucibacter sp. M5-1]